MTNEQATANEQMMTAEQVHEYAIGRARFKARQLVGKHGFTESDVDDITQDLLVAVLERLPKYDRGRGGMKTFISTIIDRHLALLIDGQSAGCRDYHRTERSLDELVPGEDDEPVTLGETIAEEDARSHRGLDVRGRHERADLAMDIAMVLDRLDEADRQLCILLQGMSLAEVAAASGIARSHLYKRIAVIRRAFVAAGFDKNF